VTAGSDQAGSDQALCSHPPIHTNILTPPNPTPTNQPKKQTRTSQAATPRCSSASPTPSPAWWAPPPSSPPGCCWTAATAGRWCSSWWPPATWWGRWGTWHWGLGSASLTERWWGSLTECGGAGAVCDWCWCLSVGGERGRRVVVINSSSGVWFGFGFGLMCWTLAACFRHHVWSVRFWFGRMVFGTCQFFGGSGVVRGVRVRETTRERRLETTVIDSSVLLLLAQLFVSLLAILLKRSFFSVLELVTPPRAALPSCVCQ